MVTLNCLFHLMMIILLFSYSPEKSAAALDDTPECKRPADPKESPQSTFELFDRHAPCSPTGEMMPSTENILEGDRLTVESLLARFKPKTKTNKYNSRFLQDTKQVVDIPARAAGDNYAINIRLGTPKQNLPVALDTTSDLTWIRCVPVDKVNNLEGVEFEPGNSTSFSNFFCNSTQCTQQLPDHTCNKENICSQNIRHFDGSYEANGTFSGDNLTMITEIGGEVFERWPFVCATEIDPNNSNLNVDIAGVLGLARNSFFVKQIITQNYGGMFSYCIPSDTSKTGFLKLGKTDYPKTVKFTPFITTNLDHPSFYFINITSISVGGAQLSLNPSDLLNPGTIIDSRVSITRLPLNVYVMIRNEFRDQMEVLGNYSPIGCFRDDTKCLDSCYKDNGTYTNFTSTPNITFTFNGGVTLNFDAFATVYDINSTLIKCFAFANNSGVGDNLAIIGNTHQKNLEVVYDYEGKGLGFVPDGC